MPRITMGNKTIYHGRSKEDAEMILEVLRELPVSIHYLFDDHGPATPTGICGRAIAQGEWHKGIQRLILEASRSAGGPTRGKRGSWGTAAPAAIPPPQVETRLIAASTRKTFDQARTEWEFSGEIIHEETQDFQAKCDLCGPKEMMKRNFVIHNTLNRQSLRVGSVCIQRFLILAGAASQEESGALFGRRVSLGDFSRQYARWIHDLSEDRPPERSVAVLRGLLEKHFGGPISPFEAEIMANAARIGGAAKDRFIRLATGQPLGVQLRRQRDRKKEKARIKHVMLAGIGRSRSRL